MKLSKAVKAWIEKKISNKYVNLTEVTEILKGNLHDFSFLNGRSHQKLVSHSFQTKKTACQKKIFWLSYDCSKLKFSEGPKNYSVAERRVPNDVRVAHLAFLGEIAKHIV